MPETIQEPKIVKANKQHKCSFCGGKIVVGERYHVGVLKNDDLYRWKSHLTCDELAVKMNMYDGWGDGVTAEDFQEHVMEYAWRWFPDACEDDLDFDELLKLVKVRVFAEVK